MSEDRNEAFLRLSLHAAVLELLRDVATEPQAQRDLCEAFVDRVINSMRTGLEIAITSTVAELGKIDQPAPAGLRNSLGRL